MRALAPVLCLMAALAAVTACSAPQPPAGRWEGTYESRDTMIVARLEIEKDGGIRVSAPDATDMGSQTDVQRAATLEGLEGSLQGGWDDVAPRKMDFDGNVFRKPGGIAPQIEWNKDTNEMTLVVYLGTRPSIEVPLKPVKDFSQDE